MNTKLNLFFFCIFGPLLIFGQNYPKQYFIVKHKADSLFSIGAYTETGLQLSLAISLAGPDVNNADHVFAANAWALANIPDSVFSHLEAMASNGKYVNFDITPNKNLISLHNDKRWQSFVDRIKKFDLPLLCAHTYDPDSAISIAFTIDPKSSYLKDDNYGIYFNGLDNVTSVSTHAYSLLIQRSNEGDFSKRSLRLDLNSPILNSGAIAQGLITDKMAHFHVFYKFDTTVKPSLVYNFRDMPIGTTVISPRTEIYIHINGKQNVLLLGYWGLGECNEKDGQAGRIGGTGTTGVKVTRNSEKEYTVEAPEESIGRLWDVSNLPITVDKGLFKTAFVIHLKYQ